MSLRHKAPKHKRTKTSVTQKWYFRPLTFCLIFGIIGSIVLYSSFADPAVPTTEPPIANNPALALSCEGGIDIGLVADVSGSMKQYIGEIRTAYTGFVGALLPSTKSEFSLTEFSNTATPVSGFTNNVGVLDQDINGLNAGGDTDWYDGLATAYSLFQQFSDSTRPKLMIIATDGNPNEPGGTGRPGGGTVPGALYAAMDEANIIKEHGIHILAVGIGQDLTISSLQAITGTNLDLTGIDANVSTSDYSTFGQTLANIANVSCGSGSTGTGGTGTGTSGQGSGVGGKGTGTEGIGTGTKGTGTGTGGTGTGSAGTGKSTTTAPSISPAKSAHGTATSPAKSAHGTAVSTSDTSGAAPSTTATKGTSSKPSTTHGTSQTTTTTIKVTTTSPNPAPTPVATTVSPQPTPVPTPTAQGTQTQPPAVTPSPFYDGKQYTKDSVPDNLASVTVHHRSNIWWLPLGGVIIVIVAFLFLRKRSEKTLKPKAVPRKNSKRKTGK